MIEPKSCLGKIFNFKLDSFASKATQMHEVTLRVENSGLEGSSKANGREP